MDERNVPGAQNTFASQALCPRLAAFSRLADRALDELCEGGLEIIISSVDGE